MNTIAERSAPDAGLQTGNAAAPNPAMPGALNVLGQRLKEARNRLGYSQERVAKPEFTKSYVSAVERGKARPSLKALELMAARLGIPTSELLALPLPAEGGLDPRAQAEAIALQLDLARRAIDTGRARQAMEQLDALESTYGEGLPDAGPEARFRLHYTRGLAHTRLEEPSAAHKALALALPAAEAIGDGGESVERVYNLIGGAYAQQSLPRQALELHARGLAAIQAGTIRDLNLKLSVYSNLANDQLALGEVDSAIATYQDALALAEGVNNLESQAGIYWELSQTHREMGNLEAAKRYAVQALGIQEAAQNMTNTAQINISLAEILAERGDYAEADQILDRASNLLLGSGNRAALSSLHQRAADIELRRGQLEAAARRAEQALQLSEAAYQAAAGDASQATTLRAHLRAQQIAGRVAEAQGDTKRSDKLFQGAVTTAQKSEAWDTASELAQTYAEILAGRGQHAEASNYYREALKRHPSSRR
jgi:tetratricopeptide (TPR) repeat protein